MENAIDKAGTRIERNKYHAHEKGCCNYGMSCKSVSKIMNKSFTSGIFPDVGKTVESLENKNLLPFMILGTFDQFQSFHCQVK